MKSSNKGIRFPPEPLNESEVAGLLAACAEDAAGTRNRALVVVLWRAGLRISEALGLFPKDLDANRGTARVLHGKGDRSRLVGLDPRAWAVLQSWLDLRAALGIDGRAPVFCTLGGKRIATAYVRALMKRLSRKAGIAKRVHAHGLRHTHASELRQEGVEESV